MPTESPLLRRVLEAGGVVEDCTLDDYASALTPIEQAALSDSVAFLRRRRTSPPAPVRVKVPKRIIPGDASPDEETVHAAPAAGGAPTS